MDVHCGPTVRPTGFQLDITLMLCYRVEKQQLEAIYQLLQNQEDKFQVSSIQDLQDQLKLYRQ